MNTEDAYNDWADTYDTVNNKTRDLEAIALREVLGDTVYETILEIGCGTGKNSAWLAGRCNLLTAVDFSAKMLRIARTKINSENVDFRQADITESWSFNKTDLITCSLVLEHIENLSFIFQQAARVLGAGGRFYVCELHPYKQLQGSRARFEKDGNVVELEYFVHHISAYFGAAQQHGLACRNLQEWFDDEDKSTLPRLVSFLFEKG